MPAAVPLARAGKGEGEGASGGMPPTLSHSKEAMSYAHIFATAGMRCQLRRPPSDGHIHEAAIGTDEASLIRTPEASCV